MPKWGACRLIDLRSYSVCLPVAGRFCRPFKAATKRQALPSSSPRPTPSEECNLAPPQTEQSANLLSAAQPLTLTDLHDRQRHLLLPKLPQPFGMKAT